MMSRIAAAVLFLTPWIAASQGPAGPITADEGARQMRVMEQLNKALAAEAKVDGKFTLIAAAMQGERSVALRQRMFDVAAAIPGAEIEPFLTTVMTADPDAGLRSNAAKLLGKRGSEKCLPALAECAAKDRTTSVQVGDLAGESSARRA